MRNIAARPLTDAEILAYLDQLEADYLASELVGGMSLMIIQALRQRIVEHPREPHEITGFIAPL